MSILALFLIKLGRYSTWSSHLNAAFSSSDCQSQLFVVVVVVAEATGLPCVGSHFVDLLSAMNSYCVTNVERCDRVRDDLDLDFDLAVMAVVTCDGLTACSNLAVEKWAHFLYSCSYYVYYGSLCSQVTETHCG